MPFPLYSFFSAILEKTCLLIDKSKTKQLVHITMSQHKCPICLDDMYLPVKHPACGHVCCRPCMTASIFGYAQNFVASPAQKAGIMKCVAGCQTENPCIIPDTVEEEIERQVLKTIGQERVELLKRNHKQDKPEVMEYAADDTESAMRRQAANDILRAWRDDQTVHSSASQAHTIGMQNLRYRNSRRVPTNAVSQDVHMHVLFVSMLLAFMQLVVTCVTILLHGPSQWMDCVQYVPLYLLLIAACSPFSSNAIARLIFRIQRAGYLAPFFLLAVVAMDIHFGYRFANVFTLLSVSRWLVYQWNPSCLCKLWGCILAVTIVTWWCPYIHLLAAILIPNHLA